MSERVDHQGTVATLYEKLYKPLKLAPAHVTGLKDQMMKASKKNAGDKAAIKSAAKAFFKEKGIKVAKATKEEPKKDKKQKAAKGEAKQTTKAVSAADTFLKAREGGAKALKGDPLKGVPKGNIDMTKLDRKTLKGMAKDLDVKVLKAMSDDEVRDAVSKAMIGVDKGLEKTLAAVEPAKINELKDCIGLFIDLTKATCIACPLQGQCRNLFEQHRQEGFVVFDRLMAKPGKKSKKEDDIEDEPAQVAARASEEEKKAKKKRGYNAERKIECYDVGKIKDLIPTLKDITVGDTVISDHSEHKAMLIAFKKAAPETLGELAAVITQFYDPEDKTEESLGKLVMFWADYFTQLGMMEQIKA